MQTKSFRIVILGNNLSEAFSMRQWLDKSGHHVVGIASSLAQACQILQHEPADLALVETALYDGTDGAQVARTLAQTHGLMALFVTTAPHIARQASDAAAGCVIKPVRPLALLTAIERAFGAPQRDPLPANIFHAFEIY